MPRVPTTPTPLDHTHVCAHCGYRWSCLVLRAMKRPKKACPVDVAGRTNRDGPRCRLCLLLEDAYRAADMRGLPMAAREIELVLRMVKRGTWELY